MKLSILMAGLSTRHRPIEQQIISQLYQTLSYRQITETTYGRIKAYRHPDVEFLTFIDNGELTSGKKRNLLIDNSSGDYICFIDDDDEVNNNYVYKMYSACLKDADVVTFNLQMFWNNQPKEIWQFGLYHNMRRSGLMCVNHLCAWKRALATLVRWDPLLGNSDDRVWFEPLFHAGLIKTQYHINETLYFYMYDSYNSTNQKQERIRFTKSYMAKGLRCFKSRTGEELYVETNPHYINKTPTLSPWATVRDKDNNILTIHTPDFVEYHTIRP